MVRVFLPLEIKRKLCLEMFKESESIYLSRPSEHPPVRGGEMSKRLGGDHRLQRQNLFMAFNIFDYFGDTQKFDFTVDEGKGRPNHSRDKELRQAPQTEGG